MKKIAMLIVLVVVGTADAQNARKVSLQLGRLTVYLGQPKTEILAQCAQLQYKLIESPRNSGIVILDAKENVAYNVKFKAGRLTFAGRPWSSESSDPVSAAIGALSTMSGATCRIIHDPSYDPGETLDRVYIQCGERAVLFMNGTTQDGKVKVDEVSELIGNPN